MIKQFLMENWIFGSIIIFVILGGILWFFCGNWVRKIYKKYVGIDSFCLLCCVVVYALFSCDKFLWQVGNLTSYEFGLYVKISMCSVFITIVLCKIFVFCNRRTRQLVPNIVLPLFLLLFLLCNMFYWWAFNNEKIGKFLDDFSLAIVALLTGLCTHIGNEINSWHKQIEDEKVFLKSIREELACFSGRDLSMLQGILEMSSDHQKPNCFITYFQPRFPV